MEDPRPYIGIILFLTLIGFSCDEISNHFYSVGPVPRTGRDLPNRNIGALDSTIAAVPTLVGSEWVYFDSMYSWPYPGTSLDTSVVRIVSVLQDSIGGIKFTYQETYHEGTFTSFVRIKGDTLISGGIWGGNLIYPFPLTVGMRWFNFYQYGRMDSGIVLRRERVTVKAGTFNAYVIRDHSWSSAGSSTTDRWYVPEVGIAAIVGSNGGPDAYTDSRRQLVSYHIGPRRR